MTFSTTVKILIAPLRRRGAIRILDQRAFQTGTFSKENGKTSHRRLQHDAKIEDTEGV